MLFTGTNRMVGRIAASKIASASVASFLDPLTKGFTKRGLINRTLQPAAINRRPQWCAYIGCCRCPIRMLNITLPAALPPNHGQYETFGSLLDVVLGQKPGIRPLAGK